MEICRIDGYDDPRFSKKALLQHGAFLIDGRLPCEIEITGPDSAVVRCPEGMAADALIETFRFYAEHITAFYAPDGRLLRAWEPKRRFQVRLDEIQPSQFYVDEDKLRAVASFVKSGRDVIIPLTPEEEGGRYVSLDGHTRLYLAWLLGLETVTGFEAEADGCIQGFVREAKRRGVLQVRHMEKVPHAVYEEKWNRFCDRFFAALGET